MSRWCAFLGPDDPRGQAQVVGAEPISASALHALGLLSDAGVATGPVHTARPAAGCDGPVAVGEVTLYNRTQLRARLGAESPPPDCTDVELLLRCYTRFGVEGIAAAEGMFALAIADGAELVLVRDHVGARTLFYTWSKGTWAASTSLRALNRWPRLRTGLNLVAVQSFLTFAYLPGRETLLRNVREALPGRVTRLRLDGSWTEENYWEPTDFEAGGTVDDHVVALRGLLEEATIRRLPLGEPTGVLLSGGVDSSLVTALAAKLHNDRVHTYSISFGDDTPNELGYSGLVAAHCQTRHRVLTVSGDQLASRFADTVALLDCPVGDPLTVPNLLLSEAVAADGVRVVLNGEGGDPVFGGPKNLPMLIFELARDDPNPSARERAYLESYRKCYQDLPVLLSPDALTALRDARPLTELVAPYLRQEQMHSLLNQLLHTNLRTKGAHHILPKVERITAAAGIEGRAPLFDRSVIDHAFRVPPQYKLSGTVEKWILKQAVRELLPATIVDRPKSGMQVPVQRWLAGPLRDLGHDLLLSQSARDRGLFREDTVRTWLRGEGTLLGRHGAKLWLLLSLELWLRSFGVRT